MFSQYCEYPSLRVHLLILLSPHKPEVLFYCKKKPPLEASVIFKWLCVKGSLNFSVKCKTDETTLRNLTVE